MHRKPDARAFAKQILVLREHCGKTKVRTGEKLPDIQVYLAVSAESESLQSADSELAEPDLELDYLYG